MVDPRSRVYFSEVQHFRQTRIMAILTPILLGFFIVLGCLAFKNFFASSAPGNIPLSRTAPGIIGSLVYLLGLGIFFFIFYVMRLKTEVRNDGLHIRFFPLMSRVIPFDEIREIDVRIYKPIREYGGWGIRSGLGGRGAALNVSGNRGVQLELSGGKRLLIGSQKAEELAKAIRLNMN